VPPAATAGCLFFIKDTVSSKKLLVDTGSAFSIFPHRSKQHPCGPRLSAANGQSIRCWGSHRRSLQLAGQQYTWNFLQAAVSFLVLGIDFLKHFELLVDVISEKLIPLMCRCAFLRPFQGERARSKKIFLPVLHFLHQNETTAG
jgi:hypothetical protein